MKQKFEKGSKTLSCIFLKIIFVFFPIEFPLMHKTLYYP